MLIAGANKHLPRVTQVTLAGQSLTPAHVIEKLQALVNLRTAVDAGYPAERSKGRFGLVGEHMAAAE